MEPKTGFLRDGCCNTGPEDVGSHTVCAVMTAEFLEFSKSRGNDLSTPMPQFGFPGLRPGDRWCLCAPRWHEALEAGYAPRVVLRATHEVPSITARSPISSVSPWTSPEFDPRNRAAHQRFAIRLELALLSCRLHLCRRQIGAIAFQNKPRLRPPVQGCRRDADHRRRTQSIWARTKASPPSSTSGASAHYPIS